MATVSLYSFLHRDQQQIAVRFGYNSDIKDHLRLLPTVRWTQTHRTFYVTRSLKNIKQLVNHLRSKDICVDYSAISYLNLRTKNKPQNVLSQKAEEKIAIYRSYLYGKRYSQSTIETYTHFAKLFILFMLPKKLKKIDELVIRQFVESVISSKKYAISTHRQMISSLKHFCDCFNLEHIDTDTLEMPKKSNFLPTVLSKEETIDLLRSTKNLKHRAILAMIYSCGLRIGELTALQLKHIDIDRRQVIIKNGKGRKDRYIVMANSFVPLLMNYLNTYRPKTLFVEGQYGGNYSPTSIRNFLKRSCKAAGITKKVTPHTLRHSYATHLLENGIDIRYIQELLGHSKPETTMIYTHVAKKDLLQIESPLDEIVNEISKTYKTHKKVLLSGNSNRL